MNLKNRSFLTSIGVVIIAGIVLILLAAGIAYFIATNVVGSPDEDNGEEVVEYTGITFPLGEFTTNLADEGARAIFQVEIMLELSDSDAKSELEEREPQIQDQVYTILRATTSEELEDQEGMENLREEIKEAVNERISEGEVVNVYFNQPLIT